MRAEDVRPHPTGSFNSWPAPWGGQRFVRYETWFLMTVDDPVVRAPEPPFEPTWYLLEQAEAAISYEAERLAFRWAVADQPQSTITAV